MSDPMSEGYDTQPTWTQRQVDAALSAARQAGRDEERARCVAIIEARRDGLAHVPWVASDDYTLAYCDACNELLEHLEELDSDAPTIQQSLTVATPPTPEAT